MKAIGIQNDENSQKELGSGKKLNPGDLFYILEVLYKYIVLHEAF